MRKGILPLVKFGSALGIVAVLGLIVATGAGCHIHITDIHTQGSGVVKTESRTVGPFSAVEVSGALHLEWIVGKETSLEVTGDDNLLPLVVTEVRGGKLIARTTGSYSSNTSLVVKITGPDAKALSASGATHSTVAGLKEKSFQLDVSGASQAVVSGTADNLNVQASGASRVDATKLEAQSVKVEVSGASNVEVNAAKTLTGSASGASTVRFEGTAESQVSRSGASTIKRK